MDDPLALFPVPVAASSELLMCGDAVVLAVSDFFPRFDDAPTRGRDGEGEGAELED